MIPFFVDIIPLRSFPNLENLIHPDKIKKKIKIG